MELEGRGGVNIRDNWNQGLEHYEEFCSCWSWLLWASAYLLIVASKVAGAIVAPASHVYMFQDWRGKVLSPKLKFEKTRGESWLVGWGSHVYSWANHSDQSMRLYDWLNWIKYPPLDTYWKRSPELPGLKRHLPKDAVLGTVLIHFSLKFSFPLFPCIYVFVKWHQRQSLS